VVAALPAFGSASAAGADSMQAPFTWNASTRIVVDDRMQYVTANIINGAWTNYWTNVDWSTNVIPFQTGSVTDMTCVGWYNVVWPGAHPSHNGLLPAWSAVRYLSDGINRMTGTRPASVGGHTYPATNAIVLTTLSALQMATNVPAYLLTNAAQALAISNGAPLFSANEAYYIHTESNAVYIVAKQMQGLPHGVAELLLGDKAVSPQYQIGYEKLGMGPDWTYVPDFTGTPLIFNMEYAGRPGLYCRALGATRGGSVGATLATIAYAAIRTSFSNGLPAPDEPVEVSDLDWHVGFRTDGQSSPGAIPSQALEVYAKTIATNMVATGSSNGFLCVTKLGLDADRPPATSNTLDWLWLNTDTSGTNKGKIFYCTLDSNKTPYWHDRTTVMQSYVPPFIDMSVPAVRHIILRDMINQAESFWYLYPGESWAFVHAEPSDGGVAGGDPVFIQMTADPNWYSDYRASEGLNWGSYALNGFYQGTPVQPTECWWSTMSPVDTNNAQSDTTYALNNWLLREFDKYVAALPAANRLSDGIPKTNLIHTITFSYGTHDVPPNFNFDHRVRMNVSGYALHRGKGKWRYCNTFQDVMQAMEVMLPECDMSQYWVVIVSYPNSDWGLSAIGYAGFSTPGDIYSQVHDGFYAVGGRNIAIEADYDFGKMGLTYYMYGKMFWEPTMSLSQLSAYRDRWILRSYGAAAANIMNEYYDWMSPANFVSAPNMWATAIGFIQQADAVTPDGTQEKQRLNDLKQFWYSYYLQDHVMDLSYNYYTNVSSNVVNEIAEFLWKGQMSYITPLYCFTWGFYRYGLGLGYIPSIQTVCAPTYYDTNTLYVAPAHYTAAETAGWWTNVVNYWPYTPVSMFQTNRLINGELGSAVDLNNLISVREFRGTSLGDGTLTYMPNHATQPAPLIMAQNAGDVIGLKVISWYGNPPTPFVVGYTVDRWEPVAQAWSNNLYSRAVASVNDGKSTNSHEVAVLTFSNTVAGGIYRFDLGAITAFNACSLSSLDYDTCSGTYSGAEIAHGLTLNQRVGYVYVVPIGYIYIPKGTTSLDLETYDDQATKNIRLYTGLLFGTNAWTYSRTVDIHGRGSHRIALNPGEAGSIACMYQGGTAVPYFYSIPNIWAKQPWMLMVPEDIATADGLTSYLTPPWAPTNFTAVPYGWQVNLAWQDTWCDQSGFVLQRQTGTNAFATLANLAAAVTNYMDMTVQPTNAYTYRLMATNTYGVSPGVTVSAETTNGITANGIPWDWLAVYGLPTDGSADHLDSDHDGMNNWQKWRAGTDPTNGASCLVFTSVVWNAACTGIVVRWSSVAGRQYNLDRSSNLLLDAFSWNVRSNIPAIPPVNTETDTTASGQGPWFFRVKVE
jgi:hypothetical protein